MIRPLLPMEANLSASTKEKISENENKIMELDSCVSVNYLSHFLSEKIVKGFLIYFTKLVVHKLFFVE